MTEGGAARHELEITLLELGLKPRKRRAHRRTVRMAPLDPDVLVWPRSLHDPLPPAQQRLWYALLDQVASAVTGTWSGPRANTTPRRWGWSTLEEALLDYAGDEHESTTGWLGVMLERARDGMGPSTSGRNGIERRAGCGSESHAQLGRALDLAYRQYSAELSWPRWWVVFSGALIGVERRRSKGGYERHHLTLSELAEDEELALDVVRSLVKHGRRVVRIELCARRLLPRPRPRDPLAKEVERRAAELERTEPRR